MRSDCCLGFCIAVWVSVGACAQHAGDRDTSRGAEERVEEDKTERMYEVVKTEAEWKALLTAAQYHVLREKGTERAFTGKYWDHKAQGVYVCGGCHLPLFESETKFNSGTGWPSFTQPINKKNVKKILDKSYGMVRQEVVCARCGGHMGHLFDDGPPPTGLRYCINSVSLLFRQKE